MKLTKHEDGFTLLELLVAINVSFILITLIVSVYLFTTSFISSNIRKVERDDEVYNFVNCMNTKLDKSSSYSLFKKKNNIYFVFPSKDTLFIYTKKGSDFVFNELLKARVQIFTFSGEKSEYNADETIPSNDNIVFDSRDIMSFVILFTFKNREYSFNHITSPISSLRFKNII